MPFEDEQLDQAFQALDLITVAKHFGIELRPGVQKSPFRQDKRGQSFSIYQFKGGGRYDQFKDHADEDVKGGVWNFVKLAAPGMDAREIRDLLVLLSGQTPQRQSRGEVKRKVAEKRSDLRKSRERMQSAIPELGYPEPGLWPGWLADWYSATYAGCSSTALRMAESRGWDLALLVELLERGKTSFPLLPWDRSGKQRGWAWRVEKPIPTKGTAGRGLTLVAVGYHARYKRREGGEVSKAWTFVPNVPEDKRPDGSLKNLTDFQQRLRGYKTKCPPYPFVLGDLLDPRLVIILEGQFDAVSFAAAFGWLDGGFPAGVSVFGLRGVSSPKVFLAAYGHWLQKNRPAVWVIGDGDVAGRKLGAIDPSSVRGIVPTKMPFTDLLRGLGCRVRGEGIKHPGCKDFNDVYKADRPDLMTMRRWADARGFGDLVK